MVNHYICITFCGQRTITIQKKINYLKNFKHTTINFKDVQKVVNIFIRDMES
jgi:hypothetical protein